MKLEVSSIRLGFVVGEKFILLPGTEARSVIVLVGLTELPQLQNQDFLATANVSRHQRDAVHAQLPELCLHFATWLHSFLRLFRYRQT